MMITVCHVKIFSFFPSCVAPIETGGIGVNWMLNSCTRLGNPEAYIMWINQDFVTIWASHGPHPQPHCPLFLKQLSEKSTKSYTNGCKPWENQIASTEILTHVRLEGQRLFFLCLICCLVVVINIMWSMFMSTFYFVLFEGVFKLWIFSQNFLLLTSLHLIECEPELINHLHEKLHGLS